MTKKKASLKRVCGFCFAGVISLSRSVFGKANSVIPMVISAQDGGGLVSFTNARVNISVVAGLVAPPVFEHAQYYFSVPEDVLRGTVVGIIQASVKTGMVLTNLCAHSVAGVPLVSYTFLSCSLPQTGTEPAYTHNAQITSIKNSIFQLCLDIHVTVDK